MKIQSIYLLLTLIGVFALISNANAKYENVPPAILKRYLPYIDCVLDRNPCDRIGKKVKELMPDWFKNECANCGSFIKSYAKKMIPDVQKYFPDDWQLIKQKHGGQSPVEDDSNSEFKIIPSYREPSKPSSQNPGQESIPVSSTTYKSPSRNPGQKSSPITPVSRKPTSQISVTDLFANDSSYGAKAVICLIEKTGCDPKTQYFKLSMYKFIKYNQCIGCEVPKVLKWYTDMKKFLEKKFPEILSDIMATEGL